MSKETANRAPCACRRAGVETAGCACRAAKGMTADRECTGACSCASAQTGPDVIA
ncbi:MAG: hypothetical protein LBT41_01240 [Candidatus Methanoplasma sp.]|nr:hypothetical protein [Candidatus Methanoplasma sp.]